MLAAETNCRTVLAVGRTHVCRSWVTYRKQDYSSLHSAALAIAPDRVEDYETAMHLHTGRAGGTPGSFALFSLAVSTVWSNFAPSCEINGPNLVPLALVDPSPPLLPSIRNQLLVGLFYPNGKTFTDEREFTKSKQFDSRVNALRNSPRVELFSFLFCNVSRETEWRARLFYFGFHRKQTAPDYPPSFQTRFIKNTGIVGGELLMEAALSSILDSSVCRHAPVYEGDNVFRFHVSYVLFLRKSKQDLGVFARPRQVSRALQTLCTLSRARAFSGERCDRDASRCDSELFHE